MYIVPALEDFHRFIIPLSEVDVQNVNIAFYSKRIQ